MVVVVKIKYETHMHEKKKNYERRTRVILVVHVCMWISRYSHIEFVHNIFIYRESAELRVNVKISTAVSVLS